MGKKQERQDEPEKKKEEKKGGGSPPRRADPKLSHIVHYRRVPGGLSKRRGRK